MRFFKKLVSLGFTEKGTDEQRIEGGKGFSQANSTCKGPEAGAHLKCLGSSKGASVTAVEVVIGDGVRANRDLIA